jgi:hypothetical protein
MARKEEPSLEAVRGPSQSTLATFVVGGVTVPRYRLLKGASPWLPQRVTQTRATRISVWNFNIADTTLDHARRIYNVARRVAEIDSTRGRAGDIFAFQEAHYDKSLDLLPPWCRKVNRSRILCHEDDPTGGHPKGPLGFDPDWMRRLAMYGMWSSECFFNTWKRSLDAKLASRIGNPLHMQFGDCAVLTHDQLMIVVPVPQRERSSSQILLNTDYIIGDLGSCSFGENQRVIVGGRFRLKRTGQILPFYSTHVVPNIVWYTGPPYGGNRERHSGGGRQVKQSEAIVELVRRNFKDGDLTPLVVGDFNFSTAQADQLEAYGVMDECFWEIGHSLGRVGIEHFWVGRESSFPANGGVLRLVEGSYHAHAADFDDQAVDFTDHACPYVELAIPLA